MVLTRFTSGWGGTETEKGREYSRPLLFPSPQGLDYGRVTRM